MKDYNMQYEGEEVLGMSQSEVDKQLNPPNKQTELINYLHNKIKNEGKFVAKRFIEECIKEGIEIGKKQEQELRIYHIDCPECIAKGKAQANSDEIEFLNKILGYNVKFLEMVELARERLEKLQSPQSISETPNKKQNEDNIQKAKEEVYNKDFCGDGKI